MSTKSKHIAVYMWMGILFVCAVSWSFQLTSFLHAKALALTAGLVCAVLMQYGTGLLSLEGFRRFSPLWLGLLVWTATGFFTAHVLSFHIERVVYLTLILLAASLATPVFSRPGGRVWLYRALLASGATVGGLALLQYAGLIDFLFPVFPGYDQRAYSVFGNQNLLGGFMALNLVLLVSVAGHIRQMRTGAFVVWLIIFSILLGALLISGTRTAWLAAAVGCTVTITTCLPLHRAKRLLRRRHGWRATAVVVTTLLILTLGAPLLSTRITHTFSADDTGGNLRLWFWTGAARMIAARPVAGVGLGNHAYWSPHYQGQVLQGPLGDRLHHNEKHTVHAHAEPLEWLAETGLVGVVFLGWFLVKVFRRRRFETGALTALAVFACFNTMSHSPPHLLAGLLLAGVSLPQPEGGAICCTRRTAVMLAIATLLFSVVFVVTTIIPSVLLSRAEHVHIVGGKPEQHYLRALRWPWPSPRAHESYAIFLLDANRFDAARLQLEQALEGMDTGRIHLLLAICAEARGDREAVVKHAQACLHRWPENRHAQALYEQYTQTQPTTPVH